MKLLCSLFLVPALFLSAPAARAQQMSFEPLDSPFDAAVLELRTAVVLDHAPSGALANLQAAFAARTRASDPLFPVADGSAAGIQAAIDALVERAARWQLYYEDIEQFVEEVAAARMRVELAALEELLADGEITSRPRYLHMVSLVRRIAARTIELVQAPNMRPRLAALIAELLESAEQNVLTPAHVQVLRARLGMYLVERSAQRIRGREAAGTLLPIDLVMHAQRVYSRGGFAPLRPVHRRGLHFTQLPD